MSFLNLGLFAAGALAISIPIAIHLLLRLRKKPVRWGAMRFLIEAYRKQKRRMQLERWLLLLTRCLLLLMLALALGRPLLGGGGGMGDGAGRSVFLLIDDSIASSAVDAATGRTVLEGHVARAGRVLDSLGAQDSAGVISLGGPSRAVVVPPSSDLGAIRGVLNGLTPTASAMDLAGGLDALAAAVPDGVDGGVAAIVFSEFTKGSADLNQGLGAAREGAGVRLLLSDGGVAGPGRANVRVLAIDPASPVILTGGVSGGASGERNAAGVRQQVGVTLGRSGEGIDRAQAVSLTLTADTVGSSGVAGRDGDPRRAARTTVRFEPGQREASVTLQVDATDAALSGERSALLTARIDRDALEADNRRSLPVALREVLRVAVASEGRSGVGIQGLSPAAWYRFALSPGEDAGEVEILEASPANLDAPLLAQLDALVVPEPDRISGEGWGRIAAFVERGGLLIVSPPQDATVHLWTDGMVEALGLDWRIAREAEEFEEAVSLAAEQPKAALLRLIEGELSQLAPTVDVVKLLGVEAGAESVLLRMSDGRPFAVASQGGGESLGTVVFLASAPTPSWTTLPLKPLMVPLMQELARRGVSGSERGTVVEAGGLARGPRSAVELRPLGGGGVIAIDRSTGLSDEPARRAGVYRAVDDGSRTVGLAVINPDRRGGVTDAQSRGAVGSWVAQAMGAGSAGGAGGAGRVRWLSDGGAVVDGGGSGEATTATIFASGEEGSPVSLPFLIATLVLAMVELVLARVFSHAGRRGGVAA